MMMRANRMAVRTTRMVRARTILREEDFSRNKCHSPMNRLTIMKQTSRMAMIRSMAEFYRKTRRG